jgi:hypothetical protein
MKKLPLFSTITALLFFAFLSACSAGLPQEQVDPQITLSVLLKTLEARLTPTETPPLQAAVLIRDFVPRSEATAAPTASSTAVLTPTLTVTATPGLRIPPTPTIVLKEGIILPPRLPPEAWREWPIIPTLSQSAFERYWKGRLAGTYENVFSVVGDCQSEPVVFLGVYDRGGYELGSEYAYLRKTIDFYRGSFNYDSPAVIDGLNVSSALSPDWADKDVCLSDESPVECELRLRRPAIVFVNMGTNWGTTSITRYETYLRQIVDIIIEHGALPVLSTKVDNVEGDHSINLATARVAYDYDLPLWNFWLAAQALPNGGLSPYDNVHLSIQGWNLHSFSALEVLDALHKSLAVGD